MINSVTVNLSPDHDLPYTHGCQYFTFYWRCSEWVVPVTVQMSSEFTVINVVLKET